MIAIVDYGVGNLFSLCSSFAMIGADAVVTGEAAAIERADKIILPGVGAFGDAIAKLRATGLDKTVIAESKKGKDVMGICLGMQLLFDKSYEYGEHVGLGLLKGSVVAMDGRLPIGLKIPQIGWNGLHLVKDSHLARYVKENDCVYFVHSFYAEDCDDSLVATTEYGRPITAMVQKGNVMGCQFHPEKSGNVGLSILRAFCEGRQ